MNMMKSIRLLVGVVVIAATVLIGTAPVTAQNFGGGVLMPPGQGGAAPAAPPRQTEAAPQPSISRSHASWVGYMLVLLLIFATIGASMIPSKRSHQD